MAFCQVILFRFLQFRQWGGAETPCELKERMKITVVSGLG